MKTQVMIAAAALIAFAAPAMASAAPVSGNSDVRQVTVSYRDLNLNTAQGQASLESRIRHAAQDVCGSRPDNKDVLATQAFRACVQKSIGAATAAVPAATQVAGAASHNG